MPTLGIVATTEAEPGRMDELLPLLMAHRARSLRHDGLCEVRAAGLTAKDIQERVVAVYEDCTLNWNIPDIARSSPTQRQGYRDRQGELPTAFAGCVIAQDDQR